MPPASSSSSSSKLPSNSVVIADIGLHTIKSGFTLGHTNLAYDESNTQSLSSSANAAAKGGNVNAAATAGQNSSSSSSIGDAEATITLRRTCGLDIDYRVEDADAIVESCISSLPSFASWRRQIEKEINTSSSNGNSGNEDAASAGYVYNRETRFDLLKNEIPGCVALLVPYGIRRGCVEKILQALFEGPAPPRVFLGCSSLQALHAVGATSGTVVDVGQFETRVLPTSDGSCHRNFALRNKSLGAAFQGLASVCSLMKQCHDIGENQQDTLNAINEHFLSKQYMKLETNTSHHPLGAIGDFSDDLVKIFTLGASNLGSAWFNYPLVKNNNKNITNNNNQDAAAAQLPDGNKIDFMNVNNNNNNGAFPSGLDFMNENKKYFFPLHSVLQLQDNFVDYLFDPSSQLVRTSLHPQSGMSCSTPLFRTLTDTLLSLSTSSSSSDSSSSSFGGSVVFPPPQTNLTNSLRQVLRSIADDTAGNHNSPLFRSAVSNIVLAGGGSVHAGVESTFTRTVESSQFANGCVTGGAVSSLVSSFEFFPSSQPQQKDLSSMFQQQNTSKKSKSSATAAANMSSSSSASRPHVKTLRNRLNAPWIGGALFTQLSSLADVTVSSSTFCEEGPSRCAHVYGIGGWRS